MNFGAEFADRFAFAQFVTTNWPRMPSQTFGLGMSADHPQYFNWNLRTCYGRRFQTQLPRESQESAWRPTILEVVGDLMNLGCAARRQLASCPHQRMSSSSARHLWEPFGYPHAQPTVTPR